MFHKTACANTQAYMDIFGQLKQVGHRGMSHVHHVWDRAILGACRRYTLQLQKALRIHHDATLKAQAAFLELKSWSTFVPRASHEIHDSFSGQRLSIAVTHLLCGLCSLFFESLKNRYLLLASNLTKWFIEITVFETFRRSF